MATYNFTVRAEDETGAFADREFSIQVRNNLVDRLLAIDATNAYSSIDGINWTTRAGKGGSWCDNQLGKWIVVQSETTYRISEDTINWEEGLQFRLKNDPPVYSEVEEGSEEEPELLQPAGELYDLPFTIQAKSFISDSGKIQVTANISGRIGLVQTSNFIDWYLVSPNTNVSTNYFGIEGASSNLSQYTNIVRHNGRYVIFCDSFKGFIVSDDLESYERIIPNNSLSWGYGGSYYQHYYFNLMSVNGVLIINNINRSITGSSSTTRGNYRSYIWYSIDLNTISVPTGNLLSITTSNHSSWNVGTSNIRSNSKSFLYSNGIAYFVNPRGVHSLTTPLSADRHTLSTTNGVYNVSEIIQYKGEIYALLNGSYQTLTINNTLTIPTTVGLPTSGLVSIAAL